MKKLIALLVVPAVALAPGVAQAHSKRAKVYKGTFSLVGADGDYVTGHFGKAQLVDNKRNDKLSVHIRRAGSKTTYTYKLLEGTCKAGAPAGTEVAGFTYKPLKTNRKGVGNSTARSKTFTAKRDVSYSVAVYFNGEVVMCAQLRTKYWKGKAKGHDKPKGSSGDAPGQADDKQRGKSGDAPGQAEDKQRGKSDDAPGRAQDKTRGKSDDAPGRDKSRRP